MSIAQLTKYLESCERVAKLSDASFSEADRLVYFYKVAIDLVNESKELLDQVLSEDVPPADVCRLAGEIEGVMSRLFSDMQYPRSYRWFFKYEEADLES